MSTLNNIYLGNIDSLKSYYSKHDMENIDIELAFSLYSVSKDDTSLSVLKEVMNVIFVEQGKIETKDKFAQLFGIHIGFDSIFFDYFKDQPAFKSFISDYHESLTNSINFMQERMKVETVINHNTILNIEDFNAIKSIIEKENPAETTRDIPNPVALYPFDWRLPDLKNTISEEHANALHEELVLKMYMQFKKENIDLTHFDKFIEQALTVRHEIVSNSAQTNYFSPLVYCIHKDIVSVICKKEHIGMDLDSHNLWANIVKYDLDSIGNTTIAHCDTPKNLILLGHPEKSKKFIWVLTNDGEVAIGEEHNTVNNPNAVHHIDLANGKDVISAGMILFSEDMKSIIAINPGSGHYRPSIDSCMAFKEVLDKSHFDTMKTVICDFNWNTQELTIEPKKPFLSLEKALNNCAQLRRECFTTTSNKDTKPHPKSII